MGPGDAGPAEEVDIALAPDGWPLVEQLGTAMARHSMAAVTNRRVMITGHAIARGEPEAGGTTPIGQLFSGGGPGRLVVPTDGTSLG